MQSLKRRVLNKKQDDGRCPELCENTAVGIRHADHVVPSIRKSWY
jgi:hypothetical protein